MFFSSRLRTNMDSSKQQGSSMTVIKVAVITSLLTSAVTFLFAQYLLATPSNKSALSLSTVSESAR